MRRVVVAREVAEAFAAGEGPEVVSDITSTTNKMGLDHIKMCTLLNGEADIIKTEG